LVKSDISDAKTSFFKTGIFLMTNWDMLAIAAIVLMGIPHGGLDGAIARRVGWSAGTLPWLGFHLIYICLAMIVIALWWLFPLYSLGTFLALSAFHFGASDIAKTTSHWLPWIAHGGFVSIAIPSLQPVLVEPVFAMLVGTTNATVLMNVVEALFIPWAMSIIIYPAFVYKHPQYRMPLLNLLLLITIASILPPLISFALYFCLWHSRSHMLLTWRSLKQPAMRSRACYETVIYSLMAWSALIVGFYYLQASANAALIQLTFIGLAALTVPHMLLVDFANKKSRI
jgi:Brp/Blh family beta-carotene 15,15'-monooxygenase